MIALVLATLSLGLLAVGHLRTAARLRVPRLVPRAPAAYPSISVVRPIRGLDVEAAENVRALLALDYPGDFEVLFVLDSEDDPGFAITRQTVELAPTRASRAEVLIAGAPRAGETGKLHAMQVGEAASRGELIAFNDSDTRPDPKLLATVVAALLEDPHAGSAFAPVLAFADRPTAGDVGYALLMNAWYGPSVARAVGPDGQLPFLMGQLMVFRREALAAIGGLGAARGQFVDDMFLGRELFARGFHNRVVAAPLRVAIGGMSFGEFLRVFRRWVMFSESGLPFRFTAPNWVRGAAAWIAWPTLAVSLASGSWAAAAISLAAIAVLVASQASLQRALGGPRLAVRHFWVAALLPLLGALVALSGRFSRQVSWRGRRYDLSSTARLRVPA